MNLNNPRVNILLSSYNGGEYLKQQIESILNQTYKNISLFIRDDGSDDPNTIEVLKLYSKHEKIKIIKGANLGFEKSFFELLKLADNGDFWSFSDQDDIWLENKISWAVEWMLNQKSERPLLFCSSYTLANEDLSENQGSVLPPKEDIDFRMMLTDCVYQGFCITINRSLREMMIAYSFECSVSHDWWACLLVAEFGNSCFDDKIASVHRRLLNSKSGMSLDNRSAWFKKAWNGQSEITNCSKEFYRLYYDKCNNSDKKLLKMFVHDRYVFVDSMKKAFYPKRWRRQSLVSEFVIRFLMFFGRI